MKKDKYIDGIEYGYCRVWTVLVFKDKIPKYIQDNLNKKWIMKRENIDIFEDMTDDEYKTLIAKHEKRGGKCYYIYCDFMLFDLYNDLKKIYPDQIKGLNIIGWLFRNHKKNKNLICAYSWDRTR